MSARRLCTYKTNPRYQLEGGSADSRLFVACRLLRTSQSAVF